MSINKRTLISLNVLGILVAGFAWNSYLASPKEPRKVFIPYRKTEKLKTPISVSLEKSSDGVIDPDQVFRLKAKYISRKRLPNVTMKWIIPAGVEVVSGSIEVQLPFIKPGEELESEIVLISRIPDNAIVNFSVESVDNGVRIGNSAQYNTYWEYAIRAENQRLLENSAKIK